MKKFRCIAILIGVVLVELFLCVKLTLFVPGNMAKEPYRRQERVAALRAYGEDRSPENEKLYREEYRLVDRHVFHRQLTAAGILFAFLLVMDTVVVLGWRKNGKRKAAS